MVRGAGCGRYNKYDLPGHLEVALERARAGAGADADARARAGADARAGTAVSPLINLEMQHDGRSARIG